MARNGVIGVRGGLPWRLSADLRRFKQLTLGHHIIMGRKTFESIGRLLPGRTTIIVTRQPDYVSTNHAAQGALVAHGLNEALELASDDSEAFVIGGAEIYRQALPLAERIYLTEVESHVAGDAWFPDFDRQAWQLVEQESHPADDRNEFSHIFSVLERSKSPSEKGADPLRRGK